MTYLRIPALLAPIALFVLSIPNALALSNAPLTPPTSVGIFSGGIIGVVCVGLQWLFTAAVIFSIILALLAAYDYMTSAGDPGKVKSATNRLIFTAIGVAVAILARSLPVLVGSLTGASPSSTDTTSLCPSR